MIKKLSTILFFCCFSTCFNTEVFSFDAKQVSITNSGAYINDFNIQELQDFYAKLEFPNYLKPNDNIYPRVFVKKIPLPTLHKDNDKWANAIPVLYTFPFQERKCIHRKLPLIFRRPRP